MFATEEDINTFDTEPIEYIRNLYNYSETPRNQARDLLYYITTMDDDPTLYLKKCLKFIIGNLTEFDAKVKASPGAVDWRIKEALLYALINLKAQILREERDNAQMEKVLI